jgi:hypothetical protein
MVSIFQVCRGSVFVVVALLFPLGSEWGVDLWLNGVLVLFTEALGSSC